MKIFDCHSHWSTRRGYIFQSEEAQKSQERMQFMLMNNKPLRN